MKGKISQIKTGMILSYLNIGIGNLIPLFYTPIMLNLLGQSEYGLYKIASSTTSYLALLAFGIGGAVTRYLIKANTEGGKEAEEKIFGLFNFIFQIISVLTIIVGVLLTVNLDLFYSESLNQNELFRMKILVGILVINTAVNFSASSYNAIVSTHERFVFIQTINVITTVILPVINLIVLFFGFKSIAMAISSLVLTIVVRIAYVIYVRKSLCIKPRYCKFNNSLIKEILVFSFWIFLGNIVGQLYNATDVVLIGASPELATVGAAVYSVGNTFPSIIFSLAQVTPSLFMPRANKMVFSGASKESQSDLLIKVGRIQAFIVCLVCSGFVTFGQPFISFYAGPEYMDAYWVAVVIMIPNAIPLMQSVANSIIQAENKYRFKAITYLILAVANVIATYFLIQDFGIIGAAIPTGIIFLVGHGLIMNWYYWKKIHLNIPKYWRKVFPIICLSAVLCIIAKLLSVFVNYYNIYTMIWSIVLYTLIYAICSYIFVFNNYEKSLINGAIKKIIPIFRAK